MLQQRCKGLENREVIITKTTVIRLAVISLASMLFFMSVWIIVGKASSIDSTTEIEVSQKLEVLQPGFFVVETTEGRVIVEIISEGDIIVSKASPFRVAVARWGKEWHYTHIAVTKGILANAINQALYSELERPYSR